ncbi:MAG: FHA domain-containing protein [Solirubrobacteraceae bacterium]
MRRTDLLLRGGLIDPARLIGDLNLRAKAGLADLAATVARWARQPGTEPAQPAALLALDWSGAQTEITIGRHAGCDVVLANLAVSRHHARLVFRDGRWILQDLGSTNGTEVNGCPVGRCELRPGDDIALAGEHLTVD